MGVEYSWCKVKQYFKKINNKIPRNLGVNVNKALDVAVLSLDLVRPVRSARPRHDGGVQDATGIRRHGGHEGDSLLRDYEDEGYEEEPLEHHRGVDAKGGGSSLGERLRTVVQPRRCNLFVLL